MAPILPRHVVERRNSLGRHPPEDEPTVPKEAEDDPDIEGTPHEDEEQVHGEAEGDLEKAAERDPVGKADVSK